MRNFSRTLFVSTLFLTTTNSLNFNNWVYSNAVTVPSPSSLVSTFTLVNKAYATTGIPKASGTFCFNLVPPTTSGLILTVQLFTMGITGTSYRMEMVWYSPLSVKNQITVNLWSTLNKNLITKTLYQLPGSINGYYCMTWQVGNYAAWYYNGMQILNQSMALFTKPLTPAIVTWGGVAAAGPYTVGQSGSLSIRNAYMSDVQENSLSLNIRPIVSSDPSSSPVHISTLTPTKSKSSSTTPSSAPTFTPNQLLTQTLSTIPSAVPTSTPSLVPSTMPSTAPCSSPTVTPSSAPRSTISSASPSSSPTVTPSSAPRTTIPSVNPSSSPTVTPSSVPRSTIPSVGPSSSPTVTPSSAPRTTIPSVNPSSSPTVTPLSVPRSTIPSVGPSSSPTVTPSSAPRTTIPSTSPSSSPTLTPSSVPRSTIPSASPSSSPTVTPSSAPQSAIPSTAPSPSPKIASLTDPQSSIPSPDPSPSLTIAPSFVPQTIIPSTNSSPYLTASPSSGVVFVGLKLDTKNPSYLPSSEALSTRPIEPYAAPPNNSSVSNSQPTSCYPSSNPSFTPSIAARMPTIRPTLQATTTPSLLPISPTLRPSVNPTGLPTSTHTISSASTASNLVNIAGYGSVYILSLKSKSTLPNNVVVSKDGYTINGNGRVYFGSENLRLGPPNHGIYAQISLLGKKLSYFVDLSNVACGCNAGLYVVQMPSKNILGEYAPGTKNDYYCDANKGGGTFCPEYDLSESNMYSMASTLHSCTASTTVPGYYPTCDRGGCGTNIYVQAPTSMCPAPTCTINTKKPFQVTHALLKSPLVPFGSVQTLSQITIKISQGSRSIQYNVCGKSAYLNSMSGVLNGNMTFVSSLWTGGPGGMAFLDGMTGCKETCNIYNASVSFSNFSLTEI